jgi:hypothetical protein
MKITAVRPKIPQRPAKPGLNAGRIQRLARWLTVRDGLTTAELADMAYGWRVRWGGRKIRPDEYRYCRWWWSVVSDAFKTSEGLWLARGCLIRFREWYGVQPGRPNVGLKMHAEKVGEGLAERESKDSRKPEYGVLDPSAFKEDGGPSIAERIANGSGIYFIPADNSRVPSRGAMGGWDQMRARLIGDNEGRPMVVCFSAGLTLPGPLSRISGLGRRIFSRPSPA